LLVFVADALFEAGHHLYHAVVDDVILDGRIHLGTDQDTGVTKVAVLPDNAFQRHGGTLLRFLAAGGFAEQKGADIHAVAAAQALLMPADIFGDIQGVGRAETAGEKAAPAYRRAPGIQDFVEDALNLLYIALYR
jgi:hypothetical protein